MDDNLISIRTGVGRIEDQRCKRADCVFPQPAIQFDRDDRRVIALWRWPGVRAVDVPSGARIKLVSTLMPVPVVVSFESRRPIPLGVKARPAIKQ